MNNLRHKTKRCEMVRVGRGNKIILFLMAFTIGLASRADYSFTTTQPLYPNQIIQGQNYSAISPYQQYQYPQYQQYPSLAASGTTQVVQPYYQNPYQAAQCQGQYTNPYLYQRPYGYGNTLPTLINPATSGLGSNNNASSIAKNIVQSIIYAKMRGY